MKVSHSDRLLSVKYYLAGLAFISMVFFVTVTLCEKEKKTRDIILWIIKGAGANLFNELRRVRWGVFQ